MTVAISTPLLIFLKLLSRDAEETKILSHDYLKMEIIQNNYNAFQPFLKSDQQKYEVFNKQLDNWINNSPTHTLLKLKKRHADKSATHPIEEIIEKCIERCKQALGKDGDKPKAP